MFTQHGSVSNAGAEAIDANSVSTKIERERFGKQGYCAVGGRIRRGAQLPSQAPDGPGIQNISSAISAHVRNHMFDGEEGCFYVHSHHAVPLSLRHFFD